MLTDNLFDLSHLSTFSNSVFTSFMILLQSSMPIRTSKSKIYCKIQVVNNIHKQIQFLMAHSMQTIICQSKISYSTILGHCLTTRPSRDSIPTCPMTCPMTCPGRDAVLRHALVWTQFYNMPWSGRSLTTYLGRDAILRHILVGTQFNDMPWSGRSFTTYPGRDAVLRHALVGTQFYNMP